jgi:mRNA-degrading endonuclease toxin of MazEF toxin-antitoxin module
MRYFSLPTNGDIVWCLFPESLGNPGPKPRPALIIEIGAISNNKPVVTVVYGTTKKLDRLYPSEFKIEKADGPSFSLSGLAADTKFDFNHCVKLPYCSTWFGSAPGQPYVNQPKLGVLAPNLVARAKDAFNNSRMKIN